MDPLDRLARRAAAGDRAALDAWLAEAYGIVLRCCTALAGPTEGADMAQETMIRAARALSGFRGDASVRTWVLRIARNVCADANRRAARRHQPAEVHHVGAPDDEVELQELMAQLPAERREALLLTAWVGLSYAEAAAVLGVPAGTVASRVARARRQLAAALTDGGGGRRSSA